MTLLGRSWLEVLVAMRWLAGMDMHWRLWSGRTCMRRLWLVGTIGPNPSVMVEIAWLVSDFHIVHAAEIKFDDVVEVPVAVRFHSVGHHAAIDVLEVFI